MSYISRFSVNFSRIIYCVKQNIIKYSNTDIYFTIQNVVYTNNDITFQTNYLFSVFMVIDFFINTNMNNEINNHLEVLYLFYDGYTQLTPEIDIINPY